MNSDNKNNEFIVSLIETLFIGYKNKNNLDCLGLTNDKKIKVMKNLCLNLNIEYNENHLSQAYINVLKEELQKIMINIELLHSYPNHPQRSKEWYDENEKLSASSISSVLRPELSTYNDLKFEKLGIQLKPFGLSPPIIHGVMFEQVSQILYETRNKVKVIEFGCIPHNKYDHIAASPDGVVWLDDIFNPDVNKNYTMEQISKFGRLLEIKNPYKRVINDMIPYKYQIQINVQQEVCKLYVCDYLETNYNFYDSIESMLDDTYDIQNDNISFSDFSDFSDGNSSEEEDINLFNSTNIKNPNIPWVNLGQNGQEKGLLIKFSNILTKDEFEEYKYVGVMMDINIPYSYDSNQTWKGEKIIEYEEKGMKIEEEYYWNVKVYDVKTVDFDKSTWDNVLKCSKTMWSEIIEERKLSNEDLINLYPSKLEIAQDSVNDGILEVNNSLPILELVKFRSRNIKKKSSNKQLIDYNF